MEELPWRIDYLVSTGKEIAAVISLPWIEQIGDNEVREEMGELFLWRGGALVLLIIAGGLVWQKSGGTPEEAGDRIFVGRAFSSTPSEEPQRLPTKLPRPASGGAMSGRKLFFMEDAEFQRLLGTLDPDQRGHLLHIVERRKEIVSMRASGLGPGHPEVVVRVLDLRILLWPSAGPDQ